MVNVHAPVVLKRGGFAQDRRTGMVVKITEVGGRDMLVKPAYKSDGVWVAPENLRAVADPHIWGVKQFLLALLVLAIAAWTSYGVFDDLTRQGVSGYAAFWQGSLPTGTVLVSLIGNLLGLNRS